MFREMTFFARNSSFTVLGTGECVRCNRGLLNIVSCGAKNWFCCCCCCCFFFLRSVRSRFPVPLMLKGGDSRLKLLPFEIFVVLSQIEALRDNDLVPNANLFSYIHISCSI